MRDVKVNILRSARRFGPRTPECREEVDLRVEVEAQGREVRPEGEAHEVGVRLLSPDEG